MGVSSRIIPCVRARRLPSPGASPAASCSMGSARGCGRRRESREAGSERNRGQSWSSEGDGERWASGSEQAKEHKLGDGERWEAGSERS
jgi:hypothetical protein